jgi:hypothetical protein
MINQSETLQSKKIETGQLLIYRLIRWLLDVLLAVSVIWGPLPATVWIFCRLFNIEMEASKAIQVVIISSSILFTPVFLIHKRLIEKYPVLRKK